MCPLISLDMAIELLVDIRNPLRNLPDLSTEPLCDDVKIAPHLCEFLVNGAELLIDGDLLSKNALVS